MGQVIISILAVVSAPFERPAQHAVSTQRAGAAQAVTAFLEAVTILSAPYHLLGAISAVNHHFALRNHHLDHALRASDVRC